MTSTMDFSADLAGVSKSVDSDVDAIVRLVRQKDGREADAPVRLTNAPDSVDVHSGGGGQADVSFKQVSSRSPYRKPSKRRTTVESTLAEAVALEDVTTRLRRDTDELLTEAALRQKLKKQIPATRQDIIEAALQDWFRRQSYRTDE